MKLLILPLFISLVCLSHLAHATPAPRPGELLGAGEIGLLGNVSKAENDRAYSEALHLAFSIYRFIPSALSLDLGFLNSSKERYLQLNFLSIGKQPFMHTTSRTDFYARADALSLGWTEHGRIYFAPGIELGLSIPVTNEHGIAVFSKATVDGHSDMFEPVLFAGISWVTWKRFEGCIGDEKAAD